MTDVPTSKNKPEPSGSGDEAEATPGGVAEFDPWTATREDAVRAALQGVPEDAGNLVARWAAAQNLRELEGRAASLNGGEVLDLVADCAAHGLVIPSWLAAEFLERHGLVRGFHAKSWDDAFGKPFPKSARLTSVRKRQERMRRLSKLVMGFVLSSPQAKLDPMWDEWGKLLGVSSKEAQKIHKDAVAAGMVMATRRLREIAAAALDEMSRNAAALEEMSRNDSGHKPPSPAST